MDEVVPGLTHTEQFDRGLFPELEIDPGTYTDIHKEWPTYTLNLNHYLRVWKHYTTSEVTWLLLGSYYLSTTEYTD